MAEPFEKLLVWQETRVAAKSIYAVTDLFPPREQYGLSQQMRRAVVSVMSNIAEGQGRRSKKDFAHFLFMARGSLLEVQSCLVLAMDLHYISRADFDSVNLTLQKVGKMLNSLITSLGQHASPSTVNREQSTVNDY